MTLEIKIFECTAFFSFLRMQIGMDDSRPGERILSAKLMSTSDDSLIGVLGQKFTLGSNPYPIIEALIDRAEFPRNYDIEVLTDKGVHRVNCADLVDAECQNFARSSLPAFQEHLNDWRAHNPGQNPKVLDIGGRARSGYLLSSHMAGCDVTVLDIRADLGVDVVADAHAMASTLGEGRFDFVICVSVFEHLLMPWKAAVEINKVLKLGGIAFIQTHQTVGMHDMPWDYYRFSDESWKGMFNMETGFEIVSTNMNDFVRIVPNHYFSALPGYEGSGGFYDSNMIARKIGPTDLVWPVKLTSIVSTSYPG
jgi:2-polyprenyl-3-methyl-5-hydroxy-6-metoxy-1,4-benzoquinol methylase